MFVVQVMEKTLAYALLYPEFTAAKTKTAAEMMTLAERLWNWDFGRLQRHASSTFGADVVDTRLNEIRVKRNYLVHRFFIMEQGPVPKPRKLDARGVRKALKELRVLTDFFTEATIKFQTLCRKSDMLRKRKLNNLQRDERLTRYLLRAVERLDRSHAS
jgi:hypothetical protein